ncbi:MAG: hypothetical protein ACRBHB_25335 [Arenicella sp.]
MLKETNDSYQFANDLQQVSALTTPKLFHTNFSHGIDSQNIDLQNIDNDKQWQDSSKMLSVEVGG